MRLRLRSQLLCRFESPACKPLENIDHFLIRNLPEICVVDATRTENFVGDRHRENSFLHLAERQAAHPYPNRGGAGFVLRS